MLKAKTPKYRHGELISRDRYARKRAIFKPDIMGRKYKFGFAGQLMPPGKNIDAVWAELIQIERQITDGLLSPEADLYIDDLYDYFDKTVSRDRLRRPVGYFAPKFPDVEKWTF